ncbi:MAG: DUF2203 domain-containing protein [Armatimonadetes bacterium]|nr:DUF2203 domain-containing protein [Armatimonadota bacterium]
MIGRDRALFQKYFTVEEANALLPELRRLFADIHAEIERLEANGGELTTALEVVPTNGGGKRLEAFLGANSIILQRLRQVAEMGVQVKDIRRGLLDFPALRHGEEILLCWLLEEPSVEYWHDLENGFAGRRSLDT